MAENKVQGRSVTAAGLRAENARLRNELVDLRRFIDSLSQLAEIIPGPHADTDILDLLGRVLDIGLETVSATDGSLLVQDEATKELVFVLVRGNVSTDDLRWHRIPSGKGIAGWVAERGRPTIVNSPSMDDRFYPNLDIEFKFETRSILAVPIHGGGQVLGVIEAINKSNEGLFNVGDQTRLTLLCRFAGELLSTLEKQYHRHELTNARPGGLVPPL